MIRLMTSFAVLCLLTACLLALTGCTTSQARIAQLDQWLAHINDMESQGLIDKAEAKERRAMVLDEQMRISTGPTPAQQAMANMLWMNMMTPSYDPALYQSTANATIQSLGSYPVCYGFGAGRTCY